MGINLDFRGFSFQMEISQIRPQLNLKKPFPRSGIISDIQIFYSDEEFIEIAASCDRGRQPDLRQYGKWDRMISAISEETLDNTMISGLLRKNNRGIRCLYRISSL